MNTQNFIDSVENIGYLKKFITPIVEISELKNINLHKVYLSIKKHNHNLIDLYYDIKENKF